MPKVCEFQYSDGVECLERAVNYIEHLDSSRCWLCAEHYDLWVSYYRNAAQGNFHNTDAARRICKENNL